MNPPKCNKCTRLRDCPNFLSGEWLTVRPIPMLCNRMLTLDVSKQACSRHRKKTTKTKEQCTLGEMMSELKEELERAREWGRADSSVAGRKHKVALNLLLPLPVGFPTLPLHNGADPFVQHETESRTMDAAIAENKPWCTAVANAIFLETRWRFQFVVPFAWFGESKADSTERYTRVDRELGSGPRFRFSCAEDEKQNSRRSGKAPGEKGIASKPRRTYPCESTLEFNFDTWTGNVSLILRHGHLHNTFVDKRLSAKAREYILESAKADGRARAVRREIRKKQGMGRVTAHQVRHFREREEGSELTPPRRSGTGLLEGGRSREASTVGGKRRRSAIMHCE